MLDQTDIVTDTLIHTLANNQQTYLLVSQTHQPTTYIKIDQIIKSYLLVKQNRKTVKDLIHSYNLIERKLIKVYGDCTPVESVKLMQDRNVALVLVADKQKHQEKSRGQSGVKEMHAGVRAMEVRDIFK